MRRFYPWLLLIILLAGCKVIPEGITVTLPLETQTVTASLEPLPTAAPTLAAPTQTQPTVAATRTSRPTSTSPARTSTPTKAATAAPAFLYQSQHAGPLFIANFAHPDLACNWMGLAGQVLKSNGDPVTGLIVKVHGNLAGTQIEASSTSGAVQAYGPAGYEVKLGDAPGNGIFWVDLFDPQGKQVAETLTFSTDTSCEANLAILNYVESGYSPTSQPPVIK